MKIFRSYATKALISPPTYTLTTTNVLRKYSFISDLPFTILCHGLRKISSFLSGPPRVSSSVDSSPSASSSSRYVRLISRDRSTLFVSSFTLWRRGVAAFQQHNSQNSWDRSLYVVLSRYMWFNDLKLVEPNTGSDKDTG